MDVVVHAAGEVSGGRLDQVPARSQGQISLTHVSIPYEVLLT